MVLSTKQSSHGGAFSGDLLDQQSKSPLFPGAGMGGGGLHKHHRVTRGEGGVQRNISEERVDLDFFIFYY